MYPLKNYWNIFDNFPPVDDLENKENIIEAYRTGKFSCKTFVYFKGLKNGTTDYCCRDTYQVQNQNLSKNWLSYLKVKN